MSVPEPLPATARASRLVHGRISLGSLPPTPRRTNERFSPVPDSPSISKPGCLLPKDGDAPLPLNVVPDTEGTEVTLAHPEGGERR